MLIDHNNNSGENFCVLCKYFINKDMYWCSKNVNIYEYTDPNGVGVFSVVYRYNCKKFEHANIIKKIINYIKGERI